MNKLEKILLTGAMVLGTSLGINNYATAQTPEKPITTGSSSNPYIMVKYSSLGKNITDMKARAPPVNYWVEGNTLFVGAEYFRGKENTDQYIFEIELKPEDVNFAKGLLEMEIKDGDNEEIFFNMSENFKGRTLKADAMQIGTRPHYYFESPDKK